ncbi:uncharacterized protein LOC135840442 [Planococcus citri]|uniref:uncharacterized protein LOC135840442 n=1 Tax=Planococcus citri TaxID=170843 RepID=UPI0031F82A71
MSHSNDFAERMSISPSTSTQCPENSSPMSNMPNNMKTLCSKIISSCRRSSGASCSMTPENKYCRSSSPFIRRKGPFNPFNRNLKERLENPIFSPNVFSTVISPSQDSEVFKWTIDDLSRINPVPIEEDVHCDEHTDEKTEMEMQNSIDRYFTKTHMPSPWSCKLPTCWDSLREIFKAEGTICSNEYSNMSVSQSSPVSFSLSRLELVSNDSLNLSQDASTQTALSLPLDLPESINTALKPYSTENNADDINLSLNSLRRKLFFQQEDDKLLSPVRFCSSINGSPMVNRCYPSTPLFRSRSEDSPMQKFSTPDLSPIGPCRDKSCARVDAKTPLKALENNQCTELKLEETPNTKRFNQECSKVFESPKLTGNLRRNRKRRRSLSSDMNTSVSYSSFLAKQKISSSKRSFGESRMLCDTTNDAFTESQDTGYQTESVYHYTFGAEKNFPSHSLNIRSLALECWKNGDEENRRVESTPTHQ